MLRAAFSLFLLVAIGMVVACPSDGLATVFFTRDEALKLAFPEAETTQARDFFLTTEQRSEIERRAGAPLDSNLVTWYSGYLTDGTLLGHAVLDTHVVRTLPETFLIVVKPDGTLASTYVLAFYEPQEYLPSDRWLRQFAGKRMGDGLHIGKGIAGITGSTLTAHAVAASLRRALAMYAVLIEGK